MCSNVDEVVRQLRVLLENAKANGPSPKGEKMQSFEQVERRIDSLEEALVNVAILLLLCIGLAAIFYRDYQRQRQVESTFVWNAFAAAAAAPTKA